MLKYIAFVDFKALSLIFLSYIILLLEMTIIKKILNVYIILLFLNSCVSLPGINKNPQSQKLNEKIIQSINNNAYVVSKCLC